MDHHPTKTSLKHLLGWVKTRFEQITGDPMPSTADGLLAYLKDHEDSKPLWTQHHQLHKKSGLWGYIFHGMVCLASGHWVVRDTVLRGIQGRCFQRVARELEPRLYPIHHMLWKITPTRFHMGVIQRLSKSEALCDHLALHAGRLNPSALWTLLNSLATFSSRGERLDLLWKWALDHTTDHDVIRHLRPFEVSQVMDLLEQGLNLHEQKLLWSVCDRWKYNWKDQFENVRTTQLPIWVREGVEEEMSEVFLNDPRQALELSRSLGYLD